MNRNDKINDILDTLEDLRGEADLMIKIGAAYPGISQAFIASVIRFNEEILQISPTKEVTHVKIKHSIDIYKVLSVDEKAYTIQADIADVQRGINEQKIPYWMITERLYEEEGDPAGFTEEQAAIAQSVDPADWNSEENEIMNPSPAHRQDPDGPAIIVYLSPMV